MLKQLFSLFYRSQSHQAVSTQHIRSPLAHHKQLCNLLLNSAQICGWDKDVDACSGDSGGPLTFKDQQSMNNRIIIGVVSYGSSDCAHARSALKDTLMTKKSSISTMIFLFRAAGVYARVTRAMRWIVTKIQSGECKNQ